VARNRCQIAQEKINHRDQSAASLNSVYDYPPLSYYIDNQLAKLRRFKQTNFQ